MGCSAGVVHRESLAEPGIMTESQSGVSSLSVPLRAFAHTLISYDLAQQNCSETTSTHFARNPEGPLQCNGFKSAVAPKFPFLMCFLLCSLEIGFKIMLKMPRCGGTLVQ